MRRQVRIHPVFYSRLNLTGTAELRMRFLAGHLPGVERDLADDFDGQLRATDSRIDARIVIGAGDGMVYTVLADLDDDDARPEMTSTRRHGENMVTVLRRWRHVAGSEC